MKKWFPAVALLSLFVAPMAFAEGVLIRCTRPCTKEIAAVKKAGGTITYEYRFVDGIAAELPAGQVKALQKVVGEENLAKDEMIAAPAPVALRDDTSSAILDAESIATIGADESDDAAPSNYPFNSESTGVAALHAQGMKGTDVVVAIIDTGYRPLFSHVAPSRVIAPGINLVPGATEPPAISNLNGAHGTQVAGMVAANAGFCFNPVTTRLARAAQDLGVAVGTGCTPPAVRLAMIGGAPEAKIFPVKVFPAAGGSSPNSRTIAAMEAVLDLRLRYDAGDPTGLNIKVVNLSLGGGTSAAGRSLSDATIDKLIAHDILPVVSAGNEGFSSVTGGSPGTSMSALTVGSASTANHEWVYTAHFRQPCASTAIANVTNCAKTYRPGAATQISSFSSRGPTHDGRVSPNVVVNGSFSFTQGGGGTATTVGFVSGTSFSAPTVAGIAATLRGAFPEATARQVRNAIIMSANPSVVPTARPNDQGNGYVDAQGARMLLLSGSAPDSVQTYNFTRNLQANMSRAGVEVFTETASRSFTSIGPGERAEVPLLVPSNAATLNVRIRNIVADLPPTQQNQFFGDDVFLKIQGAGVHRKNYVLPGEAVFIAAGQEFLYTFPEPQAGVWRITPTGDWTNAGGLSFDVDVWVTQNPSPQHTAQAKIGHLDQHTYQIVVPTGSSMLNVRAEWMNMSASYPINDIDVTLVAPNGSANYACATGRTPEICSVATPMAGTWTVLVDGFSVSSFGTPGDRERYTVRIDADGTVLRTVK